MKMTKGQARKKAREAGAKSAVLEVILAMVVIEHGEGELRVTKAPAGDFSLTLEPQDDGCFVLRASEE